MNLAVHKNGHYVTSGKRSSNGNVQFSLMLTVGELAWIHDIENILMMHNKKVLKCLKNPLQSNKTTNNKFILTGTIEQGSYFIYLCVVVFH